jgi:pilin isopeptide linkage protein
VNGVVDFAPILVEEPGEYYYTIGDISQSGYGWTTDRRYFPVYVTVTDEGGKLINTVTYPDGQPTFVNTYKPIPTTASLGGQVKASGGTLTAGEFTVGLFDETGAQVASATNDENGNFRFPDFTFDRAGNHRYTIREITPSGDGWIVDSRTYSATVIVTDDGLGTLSATVDYPDGTPVFQNRYMAAPANISLGGQKEAVGAALVAGKFAFGLFDENGSPLSVVANDENGNIQFSELTFDEEGTYRYTIREVTQSGQGWATDDHVYPAIITVTDNGQGQLIASADYPEGEPHFKNIYQAATITVQILARKLVSGCCCLCAGGFGFGLYDSNGKRVATGTNDANGNISIPLEITAAGTYTYTLRELGTDIEDWKLADQGYPITVTVTDNGRGELAATVTYPGGRIPTFVGSREDGC